MHAPDSQSAARPRVAVEASPMARPFPKTADAKAAGDHRGHPPLLSCPSWARTRTLLIPYHFGLRRRLQRSWSGLCLHLRHHAVRWFPLQSLHLPRSGLGSALPVEGPPTSRTCTRAVSDVVSGVLPESGVLPVTPRGSVLLVPSTQVTARSQSRIRTWFTSSRANSSKVHLPATRQFTASSRRS